MANLAESIHRVLNEEYILYHMDHYNLIVPGRTDEYLSPIWSRANQSIQDDMLTAQVQAMVSNIQAKSGKAASTMEIMDALENGTVLEEILDGIAETLNNSIESTWSSSDPSSFAQVIDSSHSFDSIFESGKAKASQVSSFFNLVIKGIQAMTGGQVPQNVFTQLTKIGKTMGPASFRYSSKGYDTITPVTQEQLNVIDKVLTYLSNAASKLDHDGTLGARSFSSTVTNIFSTALGEQIARQMLESAMPDLDAEVLAVSDSILAKHPNIKLVNSTFQKTGSQKTNGKTSKVDLLNSDAFSLSLSINGQVTSIDIATNVSVKWYKTNSKGLVPSVSLGTIKMGDILSEFARAPRGIAYNITAHSYGDELGYQKLRSTIAAAFVNEWISGSGGLMTTGDVDKAQLLMVNGKLYTMTAIAKKLVNSIPYGQINAKSPVNVSFGGISESKNAWVGKQNNWDDAEKRSRQVQGIVNGLEISAHLNLNYLNLT